MDGAYFPLGVIGGLFVAILVLATADLLFIVLSAALLLLSGVAGVALRRAFQERVTQREDV